MNAAMYTPPPTVGMSISSSSPFSSSSVSGWVRHGDHGAATAQHHQRQHQHQQTQHLVEFQGRTLCVSSQPKVSCVLQAVFSALDVPQSAAANLEVPWRIMCGGRFLDLEEDAPPLGMLRVWTGGLKGGKGGFGAMLRAMAKQARLSNRGVGLGGGGGLVVVW